MDIRFPHLPSEHVRGLKPQTVRRLLGKAIRTRVAAQSLESEIALYLPPSHGLDPLIMLWSAAAQHHEVSRVFGQYASSPSQFCKTVASSAELLVLHRRHEDWKQGHGLIGFAGLDDVERGGRARLHHYILPEFRHPTITRHLARQIIDWVFTQTDCQLLYGLTPAPNRAAVRTALRAGFMKQGVLPQAIWYDGRIVDAVQTLLPREVWVQAS